MRISDWSSDVCSSDLCAIGLRQSFLQDGAVAVVGLKGENPPTLFQERKQCMAVVRTHVDHDRPLQPAIEQFGYAIGLVVMRTIGPGERPDCPCLAPRVPESPLHHRPGQKIGSTACRERVCHYV